MWGKPWNGRPRERFRNAMSAEVALLRHKARRCRELARGRDRVLATGLRKLAGDYEAEADALEARAEAPGPEPAAGHGQPS